MEFPKITVVIPVYNRVELLSIPLESIISQKFSDLEVIIIDDGSQEDIYSLYSIYRKKINLRYIYQPKKGIAAARNLGIIKAKGEIICMIDSDDRWRPGYLRKVVEIFNKYDEIDLIFTNFVYTDIEGNQLRNLKSLEYHKKILKHAKSWGISYSDVIVFRYNFHKLLIRYGSLVSHSTIAFKKKKLLRRNLFYDINFDKSTEDLDFLFRVSPQVIIGYISDILGEYVVHKKNQTCALYFQRNSLYTIRFWEKVKRFYKPNLIEKFWINRHISHRYFLLAYENFKENNIKLARNFYLKSIKFFPNYKSIKGYLTTFLPAFLIKFRNLRRYTKWNI